ncbi:TonB-dependent receptor [Maricaulis parjimensis]|uniref:TonB-dependent receptor n=1 Tax=Maricaulis parjimensis TaxID=144023 RepID=UPI001939AB91|nr:TonB-dependent receptor [Maricaulis parjimensis]
MFMNDRGCVSALAILVALSGPAFAQDNDAADANDTSRSRQLDTITITAQRREETLQDAALPINAASGEDLLRAGVGDATQLNKVAPALTVSNGGGANTAYFVRGVGNFTNNGYTAPAIAFNIDGVYIGRPSSTASAFLDLNRVEVLKGPQGTLYGRNSTGGAINVIPNLPVIGENSTSVTFGFGNYSSYEATAVTNISAGSNSAFRLAATTTGHDGYFDDGTGDAEDIAVRAQYLVDATDSLSIRLSADYSTQGGVGSGLQTQGVYTFAPFSPNLPVPNWPFIPAPTGDFAGLHDPASLQFIQDNSIGAPLYSPLTGYAYPSRDDRYWGVSAEINYAFDWGDLVIIPAYRNSTLDNQFNGPPFKAAINQDEAEQYSIEARLSGSTDVFDYILGAYWFEESVEGVNAFNQFATITFNDFASDVESTAFFARGTWNVTDTFRLVGGVRYTDETRSFDTRAISMAGICLDEPAFGPPSCPQVPTLPVGLTPADTLGALDPALLTGPPLFVLLDQIANNPAGVPAVTPYGPFGPMGPGALIVATPTVVDRESGDEEVTYRIAVEYDLTDENLLYASFETGFRAGGFNQAFGFEEYDPEFIDAFTLGSKNRFFDNTLELNAEIFFWEYEGQQLAALGLDGRGNNSFYTRNVGDSSIQGVEIDFQYAATETTSIRGMVQYLDASYDSYSFNQVDLSDDTDPPNFLTPVTGCDTTQLGVDGNPATPREFLVDCSGQDALNAPEWTFTGGVQQIWDTGSFEIIGTLDARYRGEREIGFNYVPGSRVDSVLTADASLTLAPYSDAWSLTAYVRNLSDEAIASTYQVGAGNVVASAMEPPRTFGAVLRMDF